MNKELTDAQISQQAMVDGAIDEMMEELADMIEMAVGRHIRLPDENLRLSIRYHIEDYFGMTRDQLVDFYPGDVK